MKHAFFFCGFNNWGKTSLIYQLFANNKIPVIKHKRFEFDKSYDIPGIDTVQFAVESHSNDDYNKDRWIRDIQKRIKLNKVKIPHLIAALCPSSEENNNIVDILQHNIFSSYTQLHLILIVNKWDNQAQLSTKTIIDRCKVVPNIKFHTIYEKDLISKSDKLKRIIKRETK